MKHDSRFAIVLSLFASFLFLTGSAVTVPAVEVTEVFRQGLNGYAGVRDSWVSETDWAVPPQCTMNYGLNEELTLTRSDDDNPLLRFDLSAIPDHSVVTSATLELYNTQASSYSGTQDFSRRVELFRVLLDWDEGNQTASPIDAPGKHGATGDHAFDYYTGEGIDVPWAGRGMAAGIDYVGDPACDTDVVNEGWYAWDVTDLVHAWVRDVAPNYGLVLRDATGWEEDHTDWRTFVSSQAVTDPSLRPKLTVIYNPDVPFVDAGPDQEDLGWGGSAVTLDGSGSHDRPGGDDETLSYTWSIVETAYGSAMSGVLSSGANPIATFTPDAAGEWEIEITVTNEIQESATDRMHIRVLTIPTGHPRIYLTPEKLAALQARAVPSNFRWTQLRGEADNPDGDMHAKALVSQVLDESSYCDGAISGALDAFLDPTYWRQSNASHAGDIALVYDWCHDELSVVEQSTIIDYLNDWGDASIDDDYYLGNQPQFYGNYAPRYGYSYALMGLATFGDNPRAQEWFDESRYNYYMDYNLPALEIIADGGAWPEGILYDWVANWPRIKLPEVWTTATGENLFLSTSWYRERFGYLLLQHWPGLADQWGYMYHPYPSIGDSERNRGTMSNFGRITSLILIERFPDEPLAHELQAYLNAPPTDNSHRTRYAEEFLWFNPDQLAEAPGVLTHYAAGTGTIFMRSGWPEGATDTDLSATHLTFQCGDHFTYHQHYDQNSFTLFKHGDLAVESGVYSGSGDSYHDKNYEARTIAHNTLIVYNPTEDFQHARPDAESNDGGQRTIFPAGRMPLDEEYFLDHSVHYDTGDINRFEEADLYTYALGDATKAYNNPTYNQTMDGYYLDGNGAKVSRFQREFVYLRPPAEGGAEFVVLLDRVGVVDPAFSGENTKLLFHTINEPDVSGAPIPIEPGEILHADADLATAVSDDGKLFIKWLLPASRNVRKMGGLQQKAFWVFDDIYDWHWDPGEPHPRPTNDFEDTPYDRWRLELEPADTALENNFLTVLHPSTGETVAMPATTLIDSTGLAGAHIADPELDRVVLFSSASDGSAPAGTLTYSYEPSAALTLHLLFDLTPGATYAREVTLAAGVQTVELTPDPGGTHQVSDQGVLRFTLDGGCTDADGDGYGSPASETCAHPQEDCDDSDPDVNPSAAEVPGNGIDDDCDGYIDESCFVGISDHR